MKTRKKIKNSLIITITIIAVLYMIMFIGWIPFIGLGKMLAGSMAWCIAGIWVATFILVNYTDYAEEK